MVYDLAYPFIEGGGQRRLYEVALRLAERGWQVTWYCFQAWDGPATRRERGIEYRGLPGFVPLYTASGRRSIKEALSFGLQCLRVSREVRAHDVIWCGVFPYFHLFPLLPLAGRRTAIDWWEAWGRLWLDYLGPAGWIGRLIESLAIRLYSRTGTLVAPSEMTRSDILRLGGRPDGVVTIPLGVDLAAVARIARAGSGSDLVYAGRLKDHKNVAHILQALALLKERGIALSLAVVGEGPEKAKLEALAAGLGIGEQVRFLGALPGDQMFAVIKAASLFVHPSTKEGGGSITAIEANACGTPLVIYRHPAGIDPRLIRQGVNGWIVEQIGPEHLAGKLRELVQSRTLERFDRAACVQCVAEFDWSAVAARYAELFEPRQPALRPAGELLPDRRTT